MSKVIKILAGCLLCGFSAFYLLGIILVAADARESASYSLSPYLMIEEAQSIPVGEVLDWQGEQLTAEEGYTFYRILLTVQNQTSVGDYGVPEHLFSIEGDTYDDVARCCFADDPENYDALFYDAAFPAFPGKTDTVVEAYVEARRDIDEIRVVYYPNWDENEIICYIPLS